MAVVRCCTVRGFARLPARIASQLGWDANLRGGSSGVRPSQFHPQPEREHVPQLQSLLAGRLKLFQCLLRFYSAWRRSSSGQASVIAARSRNCAVAVRGFGWPRLERARQPWR